MQKAMDETKRRRAIQHEFNLKNNLTPKTIMKSVSGGVIETLRGKRKQSSKKDKNKEIVVDLSTEQIEIQIASLKKEMQLAARELRFEDAASLRDEIKTLKEARLLF